MKSLSPSFFTRSTKVVAQELLGKVLIHKMNNQTLSGRIVETEAYLGVKDKACHTFAGRKTPRTEAMYLPGGHAYVYLIYGKYYCLNVVTRTEAHPEAVLIRAVEPIDGLSLMHKNRKVQKAKDLTNGPGKLCQAMQITKQQNGMLFNQANLFLLEDQKIPKKSIVECPRIGVDYAEEAKNWPLRYYIKNNIFVSKLYK